MAKREANRTRIKADWQPDSVGSEYAREHGVDAAAETENFRDYHLARGSLMADWAAAWRTWVRNAVRFASKAPAKPGLLAAIDAADAFGAVCWAHQLRDAKGEMQNGHPVLALCGYPIIEIAREICEAAGWDQDHRGDLQPIAEAIREGCDPDMMVDVVKAARRPERPTLRYYAAIWRDRHGKAA